MSSRFRIFTFSSSAPPNLRIECRRRTIWCHRGILTQHSGYFYDHFRGGRFYWQPIHTMRFRANVDVDAFIAAISTCYDSSGRYEYAVPEHRDERVFHSKVVKTARWLEMDGLLRVAILNATLAEDDE